MSFREIFIQAQELGRPSAGQPARVRRGRKIFPSASLLLPSMAFGHVSPGTLTTGDQAGLWDTGSLNLNRVFAFEISDALVHPPMGVITLGDLILEETIAHMPLHLPGYKAAGDKIEIPSSHCLELNIPLHALGGNFTNHFHWMLEIVPQLRVKPFADILTHGKPIYFPAADTGPGLYHGIASPQRKSLSGMSDHHAIRGKSLVFVPSLVGFGITPNPNLRPFLTT